MRMFHTPRTMFMFLVSRGIGMANVPGLGLGVSSLEGVMSANGTSGRAATALLLSNDNDPMVVAALLTALLDKDWSVRAAAVHATALRNDPSLIDKVAPLLQDKHMEVRTRAAAAFLRLEMIKAAAVESARKKHGKGRGAASGTRGRSG